MTPEGKVKHQIKRVLKHYERWTWYDMKVSMGYGKHGVPDFLICCCGVFMAVEAKATGSDQPTDLQRRQLDLISSAGGKALVVFDGAVWLLEEVIRGIIYNRNRYEIMPTPLLPPGVDSSRLLV